MITLYLREHGTHNQGMSFDFVADLDNYNNTTNLLTDLYEHTEKQLDKYEIDYTDEMEEWLITDYEINGSLKMRIGEYESLEKLIKINNTLNEFTSDEILLISAVMESGISIEEAIKTIENGELDYYYGDLEDWAYDMVDDGSYGEIDDKLINYIDYQAIARDMEINGYTYSTSNNISIILF